MSASVPPAEGAARRTNRQLQRQIRVDVRAARRTAQLDQPAQCLGQNLLLGDEVLLIRRPTTAARGKIDLGRVRAHWPDLLRLVGSIQTSGAFAAA